METSWQDLLISVMIAFTLGIGAIVLFVLGSKRIGRFFSTHDAGDAGKKLKDNIFGNVFIASAIALLLPIVFLFISEKLTWRIVPLSLLGFLCLAPAIPINVLGTYWQDYRLKNTYGGFVPLIRENYRYATPDPTNQPKVGLIKVKTPRKALIWGATVGMLAFLGGYFVLTTIGMCIPDKYLDFTITLNGWDASAASGIFLKLCLAGSFGIGLFAIIVSIARSRRIQHLKNGQTIDDE